LEKGNKPKRGSVHIAAICAISPKTAHFVAKMNVSATKYHHPFSGRELHGQGPPGGILFLHLGQNKASLIIESPLVMMPGYVAVFTAMCIILSIFGLSVMYVGQKSK
jgi:hypothetical protein